MSLWFGEPAFIDGDAKSIVLPALCLGYRGEMLAALLCACVGWQPFDFLGQGVQGETFVAGDGSLLVVVLPGRQNEQLTTGAGCEEAMAGLGVGCEPVLL